MKIKDLKYIKRVHNQLLTGVYNPEMLTKAFSLIKPEQDAFFVNVQQKKRAVAGFIQYQYEQAMEKAKENGADVSSTPETTQKFGKEGLTAEEIAEGKDPINTEEVVLEKPTTQKKKRVYKRKKKNESQ